MLRSIIFVLLIVVSLVYGEITCEPQILDNAKLTPISGVSTKSYYQATIYDPNNPYLEFKVYSAKPSTNIISITVAFETCTQQQIGYPITQGNGVLSYIVENAQIGNYVATVITDDDSFFVEACVDGCASICTLDCSNSGFCNQTTKACTCSASETGDFCDSPSASISSEGEEASSHAFIVSFVISFLAVFGLLAMCRCFRNIRRMRTRGGCRRLWKRAEYARVPVTEEPLQIQEKQAPAPVYSAVPVEYSPVPTEEPTNVQVPNMPFYFHPSMGASMPFPQGQMPPFAYYPYPYPSPYAMGMPNQGQPFPYPYPFMFAEQSQTTQTPNPTSN